MKRKPKKAPTLRQRLVRAEQTVKLLERDAEWYREYASSLYVENEILRQRNQTMLDKLPNQTTHLRVLATIRRDLAVIDERFVKMNIPLVAQELDT